jgi:hypothetical protein
MDLEKDNLVCERVLEKSDDVDVRQVTDSEKDDMECERESEKGDDGDAR